MREREICVISFFFSFRSKKAKVMLTLRMSLAASGQRSAVTWRSLMPTQLYAAATISQVGCLVLCLDLLSKCEKLCAAFNAKVLVPRMNAVSAADFANLTPSNLLQNPLSIVVVAVILGLWLMFISIIIFLDEYYPKSGVAAGSQDLIFCGKLDRNRCVQPSPEYLATKMRVDHNLAHTLHPEFREKRWWSVALDHWGLFFDRSII